MIVCWNPFVICALFLDISSWLSQLHPHQPCHSAQVSQTISDPNWSSENDTSSHLTAMVRPRKGPWTPQQNLQRFGFRASRKKWDNWNLETKFLWFFPAEIGISDQIRLSYLNITSGWLSLTFDHGGLTEMRNPTGMTLMRGPQKCPTADPKPWRNPHFGQFFGSVGYYLQYTEIQTRG